MKNSDTGCVSPVEKRRLIAEDPDLGLIFDSEIAKRHGASATTVYRVRRDLGIPRPSHVGFGKGRPAEPKPLSDISKYIAGWGK